MNSSKYFYHVSLISTTLILFLILASSTVSAATAQSSSPTITETQITSSGSAYSPEIYSDKIVWEQWRTYNDSNGYPGIYSDIYMYDLSTEKETQITTSGSAANPSIYGDRIVWQDDRNGLGNRDIYMYDISTKRETQITTNKSDQIYPVIYKDRIVWQDDRNGGSDIYIYDLSTKKETKISTIEYAEFPDIYGNMIIWGNSFSPETEIYMYDLSTKITVNTAGFARIYGNRLVWDDGRKDAPDTDPISDIHMYDISTKKETQITTSGSAHSPEIYGDRILWLDSRNGYWNSDIYMYDLSTNKETRITTSGSALKPAIYGNRIVWLDSRNGSSNIYMGTISSGKPEPKLPVASFSVSPTSGYVPLTVKFTDKSANSPTSWKWSFGDGTYSTVKNPVHKYSKAGKYAVSLTVKNTAGSNTVTKSSFITVNTLKSPIAAFLASPRSGKAPLKVQFTDKSINSPTSWKWSFGDKTYSTQKNPAHTYNKAGKYAVSLTVKNAKGSNTKTVSGYVIVK